MQSCRENQNTQFMLNNFSSKNRAVYEITWKKILYSQTDHTWRNMPHAHCMLDTYGCWHTLGICNTYCPSTATVVTWTPLGVNFLRKLPVLFPLSSIPTFVSVLRWYNSFNMVTRLGLERPRDRGLIPGTCKRLSSSSPNIPDHFWGLFRYDCKGQGVNLT